MQLTHLHVHSDASLIDGLGPVDNLVKHAKALGFDALALTDHGTLANAVSFVLACEDEGIKPILGVEGYVAFDDKIGHITLLADGNRGWSSLVKLQNEAHNSNYKRRPAFTIDQLIAHADGLVCLSGCPASPFHQLSYHEALQLTSRFRAAFGCRFFIEVMLVGDAATWERPLKLATDTGIKTVLTNDVHFPKQDDAEVHSVLTQLKSGFEYNSHQLWLKTAAEIELRMRDVGVDLHEAMQRSYAIGQKLKPVTLKREQWLPSVEGGIELLKQKARAGMEKKFSGVQPPAEYTARLEFELGVIEAMHFADYFLILDDIITWARTHDVKVGPGRGSGSASLVLHCMGITAPDPLKYHLSFERFLNPQRKGFPDVDIDFDPDGRPSVLKYAAERWNAVGVATFSRYSHKSLIHDLCRHFHVPKETEERVADLTSDSEEFKSLCYSYPKLGQAYHAMAGQIRHKGKHPGGIIIPGDIAVPLERPAAGGDADLIAAWAEGWRWKELSYAGLVKFDMLGLTALHALKLMEKETGVEPPLPPDGESPVFELFRSGDLAGVFQFTGSDGITDLTKRIAPTTFEDIVAATALYRPGALDAGTADKYPEWKTAPRKIHPLIDPVLESTYGIIVYQEQMMAVYSAVTGGTLAEADQVRRTILQTKIGNPHWEAEVVRLREEFIAGAESKGLGKQLGEHLWSEIQTHTRYSFNKGHAVAYSFVSWQMAWFKFHYPIAFYTAMLNVDASEAPKYLMDAVMHGIELKPPHVNVSSFAYENDGKAIYMPLNAVKFLGEPAARAVVESRKLSGNYLTLADFMKRVPKQRLNARPRRGLLALGAFSGIPGSETELLIEETPVMDNPIAAQREWLGYVIPTREFVQKVSNPPAGELRGFIVSVKTKKSQFGPYKSYRLMPHGAFWSREHDLEVGEMVYVKVKANSGKALKVKKVDL